VLQDAWHRAEDFYDMHLKPTETLRSLRPNEAACRQIRFILWKANQRGRSRMESILIIGDDMALCSLLRDYLARHNMEVATSHDGLSGYDPARPGRFDRILVDVKLSAPRWPGPRWAGGSHPVHPASQSTGPGLAVRRLSVYGFEIDTATRSAHYRGTLLP